MTRLGFFATLIPLIKKPTLKLHPTQRRDIPTSEVLDHWVIYPQNKVVDAWGYEETYNTGPYRITEVHLKVIERI